MKRILLPLCLALGCHLAEAQRAYPFAEGDRLFVEGRELFELKDYAGCADKLTAFKARATDANLIEEADYMLAVVAYEQGRPDATEALTAFLERHPATRHADEAAFLIGSGHFERADYDAAIHWFERADIDLLAPAQQEAYAYRLAYALLQTGETERARGYFDRVAAAGETYGEASAYYLAYIDYATGDYDAALEGFARLDGHPEFSQRARYYTAQIHFTQKKYDQVLREGQSLLDDYPGSPENSEVYRVMGNAYYYKGSERKALEMLKRYTETTTEAPRRDDLYLLGVCHYGQGDYRNAVKALAQTVHEDDALAQNAYLYLGQSYLRLDDKNNARLAFEIASTNEADPQVREAAMYNYALLIHETAFTGFGESVTIFEEFLNDFPNSRYADRVGDYLIEVYLTTRNYEAALASINKINRPSEKILEAKQKILFQLGTQAFANNDLLAARDWFEQTIAMGSYDPASRDDAYFWRAEVDYRMDDYERSIDGFRTYLAHARQRGIQADPLAYYNLGYNYFKRKDYDEALNRFRQYVNQERDQRQPAVADAYNRIGDCLFNDRQFAAAEENYNRAVGLQPSAADYALYQKGFVMGLQKDYTGKIRVMDQLIRDYPQSQYADDALYEKGRAYVLLENNAKAAEAFGELVARYPNGSLAPKGGVQLGLIYYNENQPEKAIEAYKRVINDYRGSDEAKVALQDLKSIYIDLDEVDAYATYVNSLGGIHIDASEQDSLTYLAAEKTFLRGDNARARQSLSNYLAEYPQGAFRSNANFYLANIAFAEKNYTEAKRLYEEVLASRDVKFLEESTARKAEIEYMAEDYAAALETFKSLRTLANDPDNQQAAKLGIMRCAVNLNESGQALTAADELLADAKLSPELAIEARYIRAKVYLEQGERDKAIADLKVLSEDTRTAQGAEAKYQLAQLYFDQGKTQDAETLLMDFIEKGTPHQYWLARGFILLADVYMKQGDDFQARQYLVSLSNNYKGNEEIDGMIEERLSKINQKQESDENAIQQ